MPPIFNSSGVCRDSRLTRKIKSLLIRDSEEKKVERVKLEAAARNLEPPSTRAYSWCSWRGSHCLHSHPPFPPKLLRLEPSSFPLSCLSRNLIQSQEFRQQPESTLSLSGGFRGAAALSAAHSLSCRLHACGSQCHAPVMENDLKSKSPCTPSDCPGPEAGSRNTTSVSTVQSTGWSITHFQSLIHNFPPT